MFMMKMTPNQTGSYPIKATMGMRMGAVIMTMADGSSNMPRAEEYDLDNDEHAPIAERQVLTPDC